MKHKPWSKLKKEIEKLFVPGLNIKFNCNSFPIRGQWGNRNSVPRFYLQLDNEVLWDFPGDFEIKELHFGWWADSNNITALLREYIDTPINLLLRKKFENECLIIDTDYLQMGKTNNYKVDYHLTELLIAADRRIGKEKLLLFAEEKSNPVMDKIIAKRLLLATDESK